MSLPDPTTLFHLGIALIVFGLVVLALVAFAWREGSSSTPTTDVL
jgi:hypothetical protein